MKDNLGIYFMMAVCNGGLYKHKNGKNYYLSFRQAEANTDLVYKLANILESDAFKCKICNDRRVTFLYSTCNHYFTALAELIKNSAITEVTPEMLAIHIMCHGYLTKDSIRVNTSLRNKDIYMELIKCYKENLGLEISISKTSFYIKKCSLKHLEDLIRPHLTPSYIRKFALLILNLVM